MESYTPPTPSQGMPPGLPPGMQLPPGMFGMPGMGMGVQTSQNVVVHWSTGGVKAVYTYDKAQSYFDIQLVNPADLSALPPGQTPVTVIPPNEFKVGDKIRLGKAAAAKGSSEDCLGDFAEGRLGVVVKEQKPAAGAGGSAAAGGAAAAAGSAPDLVVGVAGMLTGGLCDYRSSELAYADGSKRGPAGNAPVSFIALDPIHLLSLSLAAI